MISGTSFLNVVLKPLHISRNQLLEIHLKATASVEERSVQEVSLNVSQSPYIKGLQLVSSFI